LLLDLRQLLDHLLSGDSSIRQPAEASLEANFSSNFAQTLVELIQVISSAQRDDHQGLAAVCIRRSLKKNKQLFFSLDSNAQEQLRSELLKLCSNAGLKLNIRRKVCDIIEILASQQQGWPNLMNFILQVLGHSEENMLVIGLYLLGLVVSTQKLQENDIQEILRMLAVKLQCGNANVQLEAVAAISRIAGMTENVSPLAQSAPYMLKLVASTSNTTTLLEYLTEIARMHPELFQQSINGVQEIVQNLVKSPDEDIKSLALEFAVVFVEADPSPIRKSLQFVEACFDSALNVMCSIQHDHAEWNEDEDDAEQQDFDAACDALHRLSTALGPKTCFRICKHKIDQLLSRSEWNFKYAGLNALAQVLNMLKQKKMKAQNLWNKISPFVQDEHPRVRHAAMSCLAIMCSDFGGKFVSRYSDKLLKCFYAGMEDTNNPRLQSLSTTCIVNFCEKASQKTFLKHLDRIVTVLICLCQNTSVQYVQERVCSVMAEVANTAKHKYRPYYGKFSGSLIQVLKSDSNEFLKMEALRCLTCIGRAVGPELFANEAAIALEVSQAFASQDYDRTELMHCWGRIAETLGEAFGPYLQPVVECAAVFAAQTIEQTNLDEVSDGAEQEYVEYKDSVVAIDVNKLEEKECGLELLGKIAASCPKNFSSVLQDCIKNTMPLVSYPLSSTIRSAALESMNGFCQCAIQNVQQHPDATKAFFVQMLETFCARLEEEPKMHVKALIAYNMHRAISKNIEYTKFALSGPNVELVVQSLLKCVKRINERVNEREANIMAPCLEEEDIAEIQKENEEERDLSSDATDALKVLLEIYQTDLLQMILMSDFEWMLGDDAHPLQRCTVLRIFCYIFETCPMDATQTLMSNALSRFIQCMDDEDCDVRQAAIYAVGLVAEQMKGTFSEQIAQEVLGKCFHHFQEENDEKGFDSVLDNDASVIGKVLRYQPNAVKSSDEVYKHWLTQCFPIREDPQEANWCYDFFCELIQSKNNAFLGSKMQNLPLIMNSMVDAFGTALLSEKSEKFFVTMVTELQQNNEKMFVNSFSKMKEEYQAKLMRLVGVVV